MNDKDIGYKGCRLLMYEAFQSIGLIIGEGRKVDDTITNFEKQNILNNEKKKKFTININEIDGIREQIQSFRDYITTEPLIIDTSLVLKNEETKEKIENLTPLERWEINFNKNNNLQNIQINQNIKLILKIIKKKIDILLRTIFSMIRLLPLHNVIRRIRQNHCNKYDINYHIYPINTSRNLLPSFKPFQNKDNINNNYNNSPLKQYQFRILETPYGILTIKVTYLTYIPSYIGQSHLLNGQQYEIKLNENRNNNNNNNNNNNIIIKNKNNNEINNNELNNNKNDIIISSSTPSSFSTQPPIHPNSRPSLSSSLGNTIIPENPFTSIINENNNISNNSQLNIQNELYNEKNEIFISTTTLNSFPLLTIGQCDDELLIYQKIAEEFNNNNI